MAVRTNGSSQYLHRTTNLPAIGAFGWCAWFRVVNTLGGNTWQPAISFGNTGGNPTASIGNSNNASTGNWGIYNRQASTQTAFATTPAVNDWVFLALVCNGSNLLGYQRLWNSNTMESVSLGAPTGTVNSIRLCNSTFDGSDFAAFRAKNFKGWGRAPTIAELLIESYYDRPMFPANINCWNRLDKVTDLSDSSGQGNSLTAVASPTTEDTGITLWAPRQRIFLPAAAGGTIYTLSPGGSIVFSGSEALRRTRLLAPTGSIAFSGGTAQQRVRAIIASGTLAFSGAAAQLRTRLQPASGTIVYGGSAPISTTAEYVLSVGGTIAFAGSALINRIRAAIASGTISFTGAADYDRNRRFVPTGLLAFAGGITQSIRTRVFAPTGSIVYSGSAPLTFVPAGGGGAASSRSDLRLRGFGT